MMDTAIDEMKVENLEKQLKEEYDPERREKLEEELTEAKRKVIIDRDLTDAYVDSLNELYEEYTSGIWYKLFGENT